MKSNRIYLAADVHDEVTVFEAQEPDGSVFMTAKVPTQKGPLLAAEAKRTMVKQARKYAAWRLIKTVPGMGEIRSAVVLAKIETPFRFRTKRQLWKYSGFAITTIATGEYSIKDGKIIRVPKKTRTLGLNRNHCPQLKDAFKGAAVTAASREFKYFVDRRVESGKDREMALVDLARKIVATVLAVWKKGEPFELDKALMHTR